MAFDNDDKNDLDNNENGFDFENNFKENANNNNANNSSVFL